MYSNWEKEGVQCLVYREVQGVNMGVLGVQCWCTGRCKEYSVGVQEGAGGSVGVGTGGSVGVGTGGTELVYIEVQVVQC